MLTKNELLQLLKDWYIVRKKFRQRGLKAEWHENLRCAQDIVDLIGSENVEIKLWKDQWQ